MNFTQEEAYNGIISELKKIEANPLFNERGINAMIKRDLALLKDVDVTLESYVAEAVLFAKDVDGNIRRVNTDTVETATAKAIEDYKLANSAQTTTTTHVEKEDNPALKAIEDRLKLIEDENNRLKAEATLSVKRNDVLAKFKEKGVADTEWLNDAMALSPLSIDTDIDTYVERGVKLYNKNNSQRPHGTQTGGSGGSGTETDAFFSALAELGEQSNKQVKVI